MRSKLLIYPYRSFIFNRNTSSFTKHERITQRVSDFQGTSGIDIFNKFVKLGDSLVLATLLLQNTIIQKKIQQEGTVTIHDVGGADGAMMLTLLRVLNFTAEITVNEPNEDRLKRYEAKKMQHPNFFASILGVNKKIEDTHFVMPSKRELVLASHVLYYNSAHWFACETLSGHLLTKFFRSLCINGTLCVVLQHSPLDILNSHEHWEDCIYPLLEGVKHSANTFYASADMFDMALDAYKKQFIRETGCEIDWTVRAKIAQTIVPLGAINTKPDAQTGQYRQTKSVLDILNFYLKGRSFNDLPPEIQQRTIALLIKNFKKNDQFEIVHYNKVYTIEIGPTLFSKLSELNTYENPMVSTRGR